MHHLSSPVLRRELDEPFAVPDTARRHLATCQRCQARRGGLAQNAALASGALSGAPAPADLDQAWASLQERLRSPATNGPATRMAPRRPRYPGRRLARVSVGAGSVVAAGVLVVGVAAAAALRTVYAPTRVVPVPVSRSDLRAFTRLASMGGSQLTDGLPPSGARRLPFGELRWTSAGLPRSVASVPRARALTRLAFSLPATLPSGVGSLRSVDVQPQVTATVRFSAAAGGAMRGSSLVVTGGPAILVQYASSLGRARVPTLAIAAMRRPVATATGATASQLEAFLLARPGMPPGLAREVRLLGQPAATLPVPVPAGATVRHLSIGGSPAVLIADPSGVASGVVWESRDGVVHAAAGLLDQKDILNVARQLG